MRTFYESQALIEQRGYSVRRSSSLYETDPWGGAEGGPFLNAVYEIERRNTPAQFMQDLLSVESDLGRRRSRTLEARTCDLDLLLWGADVHDNPELQVPHPRLTVRKFVLIPLCELIADRVHPVSGRLFADILLACQDTTSVRAH